MSYITDWILPVIAVGILTFGAIKGVNIFDVFLDGAKSGFKTALSITPPLIALITAVSMLNASGGLSVLCELLSPVAKAVGIPPEVMPLTLLSPVSGSGAVTMFENILKNFWPDSFTGRCASVLMGSTETTFYALTLYYGSVGIKKTRHTLPCAVCADITSYVLSPVAVKLFFGR